MEEKYCIKTARYIEEKWTIHGILFFTFKDDHDIGFEYQKN